MTARCTRAMLTAGAANASLPDTARSPMKLLEAISHLDTAQLDALAARWHIAIDPKKRLSAHEQVARGLSLVPRWLELNKLSDSAREAMRLLLATPRGLPESSLPRGSTEFLLEQGFAFRDPQRSERLVIPTAFRLQLPASPSDGPRAARILLQSVPEEARRELCHYHLKRLPPLSWSLLLESVLEHLEDPAWVKQELAALSESERQLLSAVDALGGEVSAEEVLELSREPARIVQGGAAQVPRRSAIFALARRGLVIARTDGWVISDEIERVVGRERRARAGIERQRLLMSRHMYELTPSRAELAEPPGFAAVGLLAALSALDQLPVKSRGLSKGSARRVAQQLMLDEGRAELLVCLARADGLLYASVALGSVSERLWDAWRRGGAWDEAAREPDLFRPGHPVTAKATSLIRDALLDVLLLMPASQFALVSDIESNVCSDRRALSAQRSLSVAARSGQDVLDNVLEVVRVLLRRSLPWLGLVDSGKVEEGPVVRLSAAGRAWLEGAESREDASPERVAQWRSEFRLVCGPRCDVAAVVEIAHFGTVWLEDRAVGVELSGATLGRAAERDPDLAGLRAGLSALTEQMPRPLEAAIHDATAQRPMCVLTPCAGFIEIDDPELLAALFGDPESEKLWIAPPLRDGLLIRPGVSEARVQAVLTRHGARLVPGTQN